MDSRKKGGTWINIRIKSGTGQTFRWKGQNLAVGETLNGDGHPHRAQKWPVFTALVFSFYNDSALGDYAEFGEIM